MGGPAATQEAQQGEEEEMTKDKDKFTATIDFDFPESSEFDNAGEYEFHKASYRASIMSGVLIRLKMKTSEMGLTRAEWLRALSDALQRGLKDVP